MMRLKPGLVFMTLAGLATQPLIGCPSPQNSVQPPAPPAQTAPAGRSTLPDLPPDPRAARGGQAPTSAGAVGSTALPAKAVPGSALNKFFPSDADGLNRVFTQEKNGFAMANLNKGKATLAQLSINDTAANPSARDKFKGTGFSIEGFPAAKEGMSTIAVLVGDRYQVKIRATGSALSDTEQQSWLLKFDLAGLAGLK